MRILFSSNPPLAPSGYGTQALEMLPRWAGLGHQFVMRANSSLGGSPVAFPIGNNKAIQVLPMDASEDPRGSQIFAADMTYFKADLLMTLHDVWAYRPEFFDGIPWLAWFPVDHHPLPLACKTVLQHCQFPVVLSRDGQALCKAAGIEAAYIPHGINTAVWKPGDLLVAREFLSQKDDRTDWSSGLFIVGLIGANKGTPSRKALEPQIRAFKAFWEKDPDNVRLAIHTPLVADENIVRMCDVIGLPMDAILATNQYEITAGLTDQAYMVNWYNAIDVLSHATMGEGFGLPIVEAQSCGTPAIVTDFSSMPEKLFAGWKVPIKHKLWTYQQSYQAIPDVEAITEAYQKAYQKRGNAALANKARAGVVENYDAATVTEEYWKPLFGLVEEGLRASRQFVMPSPGRRLSIVTLWHNHPEYIAAYEAAVRGADEVIIIDNASDEDISAQIFAMVERLRGVYHKNTSNIGFAAGSNQGLKLANGDIVLLLNNDIAATKPGWLDMVRGVRTGAITGQIQGMKSVDNELLPYIEGWAVAARREIWQVLDGLDAQHFPFGYWEDSDLCYRAIKLGYGLVQVDWGLQHLGGGTSRDYPDEFMKHVEDNYLSLVRRVRGLDMNSNGLHDEDSLRAYARGIIRAMPEAESERV